MRETCARVLAAALMTGAIAFALGAPALFESPRDGTWRLTAPPSSLQRSVRVPALPAPERPARAERLAAASQQVRSPAARPRVVRTTRHVVHVPRIRPRPAPASQSAPQTRELTATTPAPEVAASQPATPATPAAEQGADKVKRNGKRKSHNKAAPSANVTPVVSAEPQPSVADEPRGESKAEEPGHDKDKEKGHGHKD
jgi:hypothetical protein